MESDYRSESKSLVMKFIVALAIASVGLFSKMQAQVNKIEHFFASSPKAEKLFQFFSQDLELPVVWKYRSWGDFASGGVTLGNVAFELVIYEGVDTTSFNGIALEPLHSMEDFQKELDKIGIAHDTIDNSNVFKDSTGTLQGWSLLTPKDVLPYEANLFVCDYKNRKRILENRKQASHKLMEVNGRGLGVVQLKEIVVSTTEFRKYDEQLAKLPGVKKVATGLFSFDEGPDLRVQQGTKNGIPEIVIKVASLEKAKRFLQAKNLLGDVAGNNIYLLPGAADGLNIRLVE